jgi:hypothetical protein
MLLNNVVVMVNRVADLSGLRGNHAAQFSVHAFNESTIGTLRRDLTTTRSRDKYSNSL